jgi:threonine synthase
VCAHCFGPLEATYDLPAVAERISREQVDARSANLWRLAELLPLSTLPVGGLAVGPSPLVEAPRLAARLGLDSLWVKDDSRNPTLSFKDRVVAVAAARAAEWGFHTLACASTGNLSASVAAAAAARGLRAVVFIPADLEPAKIAQARSLGATVVRVEGPYDDVNRLCLELTDELEGWAFLNVNLRPYYAEGSKTIAFEIAQQLGWRAPAVLVAPLASGSMYTKLSRGFRELVGVGLLDAAPVRYVGGQAAGCAPIAQAWAAGADIVRPVETPDTVVRSLAIGSPADGAYAIRLARDSGGAILGVPDEASIEGIRLLAETEGILTETAGGVTVAALRQAIADGSVKRDEEVVLVITGNGLKTLDVLAADDRSLPQPIPPTFDAFEAWWQHEARGSAA